MSGQGVVVLPPPLPSTGGSSGDKRERETGSPGKSKVSLPRTTPHHTHTRTLSLSLSFSLSLEDAEVDDGDGIEAAVVDVVAGEGEVEVGEGGPLLGSDRWCWCWCWCWWCWWWCDEMRSERELLKQCELQEERRRSTGVASSWTEVYAK